MTKPLLTFQELKIGDLFRSTHNEGYIYKKISNIEYYCLRAVSERVTNIKRGRYTWKDLLDKGPILYKYTGVVVRI